MHNSRSVHSSFDYSDEHGLYRPIDLIILGLRICCLDIREDRFSYMRTPPVSTSDARNSLCSLTIAGISLTSI